MGSMEILWNINVSSAILIAQNVQQQQMIVALLALSISYLAVQHVLSVKMINIQIFKTINVKIVIKIVRNVLDLIMMSVLYALMDFI